MIFEDRGLARALWGTKAFISRIRTWRRSNHFWDAPNVKALFDTSVSESSMRRKWLNLQRFVM